MRISDWSSDVCSSDLESPLPVTHRARSRCECQQRSTPSCSGSSRIKVDATSCQGCPAASASSNAAYRARWLWSYRVNDPQGATSIKKLCFGIILVSIHQSITTRNRSEEHTSELQT